MSQPSVKREEIGNEINLRELASVLWGGRGLAALVAGLCTLAAILYAFLAPELFRSEALVEPQEPAEDRGVLGSALGQLGGLAEIAGLNVNTGAGRAVALATLKSRAVIEPFVRDEGLMQRIYESRWDSARKEWKGDPADAPTLWEAHKYFLDELLKVSEDGSSGLVTVAIKWRDPEEAQRWVRELIARTNRHLKARAIEESDRNLAYLQTQLGSIGQLELRQSLYSLVEVELKKAMLAKGSDEFALKTIDPAVVPMERESPKRAMIIALGLIAGLLAGGICVFVRHEWRTGAT
jgi:uncharacterized protein involved in exopolysaccharide biosynthesis